MMTSLHTYYYSGGTVARDSTTLIIINITYIYIHARATHTYTHIMLVLITVLLLAIPLLFFFQMCTFRASCYSRRLSWAHTPVIRWAVCLGQMVSS